MCGHILQYMTKSNIIRADNVDIHVKNKQNLPDGWSKTHEEGRNPVNDVNGYYIHSYESEHFLVSHTAEARKNGKRVHSATLLKVKRDDDGERLTAIGTGIYKDVAIPEDAPEYTEDREGNIEAHKKAENASFQLAVNLMRDVNSGKYEDKKYSESDVYN